MIYIFPLSFIKLYTTTNQHRKLENLYMGVSVSCSLLLQSWFKLLDCHCQRSCRTDTKLCTASFPCDGSWMIKVFGLDFHFLSAWFSLLQYSLNYGDFRCHEQMVNTSTVYDLPRRMIWTLWLIGFTFFDNLWSE